MTGLLTAVLTVLLSAASPARAASGHGKKGTKKAVRLDSGRKRMPAAFSAAGFLSPPGWEKEEVGTPSDPYVSYSMGADTIKVRLVGGGGSRYRSEESFLKGYEATTMGRPPREVRKVGVAGREVALYSHGYPIMLGDPHVSDPRPPQLAAEQFVILPHGRKFFVLSWSHESPAPDPDFAGEKAWETFLSSFTLKAR